MFVLPWRSSAAPTLETEATAAICLSPSGSDAFRAATATAQHRACAACAKPLLRGEARECGKCREQHVADPAYYCSKDCAKEHWDQEHRKWHKQLSKERAMAHEGTSRETLETNRALAAEMVNSDQDYHVLCALSAMARERADFREAVKLLKRAAKLLPTCPQAYDMLGDTYIQSGDMANAAKFFMCAMDMSEAARGTAADEVRWSHAAAMAFTCLAKDPSIPKPTWYSDPIMLKRFADRAIASRPDAGPALQMRAVAYSSQPEPSPEELRQALCDYQRLLQDSSELAVGTCFGGVKDSIQARLDGLQKKDAYFALCEQSREAAMRRELSKALELASSAMELSSKAPLAHFEAGHAHLISGDTETALPLLLKAVELCGTHRSHDWAMSVSATFWCIALSTADLADDVIPDCMETYEKMQETVKEVLDFIPDDCNALMMGVTVDGF